MSYKDRQKTMDLIRKGVVAQAEELAKKQEKNRQGENVTEISFRNTDEENPFKNMSSEEKDKHLLLMTKAINELTERMNKQGEGQ